ncbi:MAG: glycosyl hydrolase family 65 protein [Acidimicrobiales bacterium]
MAARVSPLAAGADPLAPAAGSTYQAVVFDWDGTAVPDRHADAAAVRTRIEALCAAGVHVVVVSGTHVGNVDGQLGARPSGTGRLHLCLNRGSEVFEVGPGGPELVWRRTATDAEERALDRAAQLTVDVLHERGVPAQVVSQRLNRRKIDIIPEPRWSDPPKARIGELLTAVTNRLHAAGIADISEVVDLAAEAALEAGLEAPRITSDVKHVEIGLTDKADSARWAAGWLAQRGITGSLVLVAGDEFGPVGGTAGSDSLMLVPELARACVTSVGVEPEDVPSAVQHLGGGPDRFLALLDHQLERRRRRSVPWVDEDPAWVVPLPDAVMSRAAEAIGALANGWAGIRGAVEEDGPDTLGLFVVNGIYRDGTDSRLLAGPVWTHLNVRDSGPDRRVLDLRTGMLVRESSGAAGLRSVRFVSAARADAAALRAEGAASHVEAGLAFGPPHGGPPIECLRRGAVRLARSAGGDGAGIGVAARDWQRVSDGERVVERLVTWTADDRRVPAWDRIAAPLADVEAAGFDVLAAEHREAWARRWSDTCVVIDGDPSSELAARLALFHLLSAAPDRDEAAVGARGLTGAAYGGHVFWDADVFVLPALAAMLPGAARAMLEYRVRRLPAARAAARRAGLRGARFPWESAHDGTDVTPGHIPGPDGELIPIQTGQQEEHIVADIAWAACEYTSWTGDAAFLAGPGRDLVIDTARYWESRIRVEPDGSGHLHGVMGPDEYHELVDDNAFTNVMARWNLRRAAQLLKPSGDDTAVAAAWERLADVLVDGWDGSRSLYEQFSGYWDLEPLLIAAIAVPPVAADVLLGPGRVRASQIIKQPDVLMLHHLVPSEMRPGSLATNLAFYDPRTAHGSSLSPAIHASLFARAGQPDRALELFRTAARLDLDDLTGTTAGGVHLATMGGVWQALAYGFLGLRPHSDVLDIAPCLPAAWEALSLRLHFHGEPIGIRADHDTVAISCEKPVRVRVAAGEPAVCRPPGGRFTLKGRPS